MMQINAAPESHRNARRYSLRLPSIRRTVGAGALATLVSACVLGTAAVPTAVQAQGPMAGARPQKLPEIELSAGMHRIRAMVADDPSERSTGLMFRTDMAPNDGMLFVFEQAQPVCFWMKNTLIPLSIAFVADDGRIVNLDEMKANTTTQHCASAPVRYVLEMNAGWFTRKGLKPGDRLGGGPFRK
jgi:hypothetical protein